MDPSIKKILIIQSMGLGDIVFALPAIQSLKKNFPGASLSFLTHRQHKPLLSRIPEIDAVLTYESKHFAELLTLARTVREGCYDLVLVLNPIFRGSLLAWFSKARVRIGYRQDYERKQSSYGFSRIFLTHIYEPRPQKIHEVERYLDLLRFYGLNVKEGITPEIIIHSNEKQQARETLEKMHSKKEGPLVLWNLGAAWELRKWPEERVLESSRWLLKTYDARLFFLGGPSDTARAEKLCAELGSGVLNLAGKTSLAQLPALLAAGDLLISNDTGIMHIGAAVKTPLIALFGPGDLVKVKPLSEDAAVLHHPLYCSPCHFQYTNLCGNNICMKNIRPEELQSAVAQFLGAPKFSGPQLETPVKAHLRNKKRILYLQSTSEIGGTDITLLRTVEALNRNQYEAHILLHKESPLEKDFCAADAKMHIVPEMRKLTRRKGVFYLFLYVLGYLPAVFKIAALIRREKIDLVHTNTIHNPYGFFAAKLAKVPHVWHIREIVVQSRWVKEIETFLVRHFSSRFIVMDDAIGEAFVSPNHGFPRNLVKIYDGTDLKRFNPLTSGERIRNDLKIDSGAPLVGIVCRLDPWKGVDIFLEAAALIFKELPRAKFLICGGEIEGHSEYGPALKEQSRQLGIESAVFFTEWRYTNRDIPEVYAAMDVSVQCPVNPEPYGLASIEAMASGVPIVTFKFGGAPELCEDGKTAFLVKPKSAVEIATAVLKLLRNKALAEQMGLQGRKRSETLFDRVHCVAQIEKLYSEILP